MAANVTTIKMFHPDNPDDVITVNAVDQGTWEKDGWKRVGPTLDDSSDGGDSDEVEIVHSQNGAQMSVPAADVDEWVAKGWKVVG